MLRKPRILVVGSFMMDLIATTAKAPKSGETVVGIKFQTAPGGKGANQAVQCARLGAHVTMAGRVGNDAFGKIMTKTAGDSGVDISHVIVDESESSGVGHIVLEVSENGTQNRITVCPGANFKMTVDDILWLKEEIKNYDLLMMQFEIPMDVIETAARWAYDAGVKVMINPAPAAAISDRLLSCVTYLSPNEHEAAVIAGHPLRMTDGINMDDIVATAKIFHSRGVKNLIITLGERGSIISDADGIEHIKSVHMPDVVDPTGAGDSFVAAFCTGLCAGLPQKKAMIFASFTSAVTVSRMGAMPSLPTVDEVQDLMLRRGFKDFDPEILDGLK